MLCGYGVQLSETSGKAVCDVPPTRRGVWLQRRLGVSWLVGTSAVVTTVAAIGVASVAIDKVAPTNAVVVFANVSWWSNRLLLSLVVQQSNLSCTKLGASKVQSFVKQHYEI